MRVWPELTQYLRDLFPGLVLNPPLFYRWPVGLRFDLGGRAANAEEVDCVVGRATTLFEAVFDTDDTCIVVAQDWPDHPGFPPLFVFAQSNAVGLEMPQDQLELLDQEEPEVGPYTLTWAVQQARAFRYQLVFEALANADHARSPAISSRVYFINPGKNVILYMYDDRGLDLIARRKDVLLPIYREFNSWILDYDRATIDRTFAD